ncbi:hypothetical protein J7E88_05595 [Streptomyces sp. ISL-10]|uniref:hypothetical protein n=1 Tax=Streptomyces sp. ISL-10 TaxID=2819172 RepID=UPI001BE566CF|nr:hypothetical protein [Streptomyces sp. ISL-10]MBT2364806.1 hypothetical protein [Streptomyces sp. ISL-10]
MRKTGPVWLTVAATGLLLTLAGPSAAARTEAGPDLPWTVSAQPAGLSADGHGADPAGPSPDGHVADPRARFGDLPWT